MIISAKKHFQVRCQMLRDALQHVSGFHASQWVCGGKALSALAIDEQRLLICLLNITANEQVTCHVIPAPHVLSAEIISEQAGKSNVLMSQLTGAVIGGALFGDAGAIVGADSGIILSAGSVKNISLQLTLNDTNNPFHRVLFFPNYDRNIKNKEKALSEAQRWQVLLGIMVKRAMDSGIPASLTHSQGALPGPSSSPSLEAGHRQAAVPPRHASRCMLRAISGQNIPPVTITHDSFTIGRAADNNLVLPDPSTSRRHAVIRFANDAWFIQDRNSKTGIFINGQHTKAGRLRNGDQIRLGSTVFIFQQE